MRILAGGPSRGDSAVRRASQASVEGQVGDFRLDVRYIEVPDPGGERWDSNKVDAVAQARQYRLDDHYAYDAIFFVDDDLILAPDVLAKMLAVDSTVVYGVFWTRWRDRSGRYGPLKPQVWDIHPYGFTEALTDTINTSMQFPDRLIEQEVAGGGACTLIRKLDYEPVEPRYWPPLPGIERIRDGSMWAGEDRTFALCCEVLRIPQVALFGLRIEHQYDDRSPAAIGRAKHRVGIG